MSSACSHGLSGSSIQRPLPAPALQQHPAAPSRTPSTQAAVASSVRSLSITMVLQRSEHYYLSCVALGARSVLRSIRFESAEHSSVAKFVFRAAAAASVRRTLASQSAAPLFRARAPSRRQLGLPPLDDEPAVATLPSAPSPPLGPQSPRSHLRSARQSSVQPPLAVRTLLAAIQPLLGLRRRCNMIRGWVGLGAMAVD